MRPESYSRWVDPAPLEIERPRLPWWTLLPRKLLLIASPILLVVVLIAAVTFLARRFWRYPLFLISAAMLAGLGIGYSWWVSAGLLAGLGAGCGLWAGQHRESFTRIVVRQVRSEWRRAVVYAVRWRRVMLFCELTKRTGHGLHRVHYPRLRRVRADGWRDRVSLRLLPGQSARLYATRAEELAHSFGAHACRVRVGRPRRIWLDLVHSDPLAQPIRVPPLPLPGWLLPILRMHTTCYPAGPNGLIFTNTAGGPVSRTAFRARIWRPSLVRAGMLGEITPAGDQFEARWTDRHGLPQAVRFSRHDQAVVHLARHAAGALTFHGLRHSYATWLEMSRIASGASFGKICELLPPATSPFGLDQGRLVAVSSHAS